MRYNLLFSVGLFWQVFLFSCLFFYHEKAFAQEEFSFSLFVEDAQGNKDTITIGYDDLATDQIDHSFGEINILNDTWENELDVRIGDRHYSIWNGEPTWINENTYLTKKQVLKSYCIDTFFSSRMTIQFHTTHYPLKLKWDKSLFQNQACHQNTVFFGELDNIHFDALMGDLLAFQDSVIIQPFTASQLGAEEKLYTFFQLPHVDTLTPFYALYSYESDGKEIGAIQFQFYSKNLLQNKKIHQNIIQVYPNPSSGVFSVTTNHSIRSIEVLSLDNKSLIINTGLSSNNIEIDLAPFDSQFFILKITDENNSVNTKKLIKN